MTYQVLARKWRPANFAQLVGQEHVVAAISNGLENDRLHHAYLFTGTRGVGKTTIARIFSKSLNCEQGQGANPCGQCGTCLEIDKGSYVDLLEIDAASRTKVEDTRELLDNVQYKPTRGRYKVYLIDEVHMLSKHSFNALLKTLEEPPPHVKFLLATTDPQKLPVTILSRCLQFNLKALSREQIGGQLRHILAQEGINFQPEALTQLARAAQGSMRDALSLTDQAIAQGNGEVTVPVVVNMLGLMDKNQVLKLLGSLLKGDADGVMSQVDSLSAQAPDYSQLLSELLSMLHQVALTQLVPQSCKLETVTAKAIYQLAQSSDPEHIQLLYQIAIQGRKDLPHAPDGRSGLEMTLLRMLAFRPATQKKSPEFLTPSLQSAATQEQDVAVEEGEQSEIHTQRLQDEQALIWQQAASLQPNANETLPQVPDIEATPEAPASPVLSQTETLLALRNKLRSAANASAASSATQKSAEVKPVPPVRAQSESKEKPAEIKAESDVVSPDEAAPAKANYPSLIEDTSEQDIPPWNDDDLQSAQVLFDQELVEDDKLQIETETMVLHIESVTEVSAEEEPGALLSESEFTAETDNDDTQVFEQPDIASSSSVGDGHEFIEDELELPHYQEEDPSVFAVEWAIPVFLDSGDKVLVPAQLDDWSLMIEQLGINGLVKQLALHSVSQIADDKATLTLHRSKEHLVSDSAVAQLQAALGRHLNRALTLEMVLGDPVNTPYALAMAIKAERQKYAHHVVDTDESLALLKDTFAASVMTQSIKPR
ncbi:DNA polymerase III subunit gamma/tau [Aliiglaciecola sp. CAU 1673]|uniref:DNA polymerase III subunit gamma/tau n=1 Tax=Aliiglaciecola sp. CAU 1673 TaxID=3032595 RepID=UPI0023DBC5F5|nr:DNA polymerase III subunit gamma/tau [Aliiglaciecola sp. CAU 1673]MDF2179557.1 DNA polymerase III subunit gamma/tau [Aliiglaciecola sp. CAU 1673]